MARGGASGRQGSQQSGRRGRSANGFEMMDDGPSGRRDNRPRRQLTKRSATSVPTGGRNQLSADLNTIIRNQKFIMEQYRKLARSPAGGAPMRGGRGGRRPTGRYFDGRNTAIRQRGVRGGRLGRPYMARGSSAQQSRQQQSGGSRRSAGSRGGRGGARGGRGGSRRRPATAEDLDRALDVYMGEDVQKQRLEADLDSYFAKAGAVEATAVKGGIPETGEIAH